MKTVLCQFVVTVTLAFAVTLLIGTYANIIQW